MKPTIKTTTIRVWNHTLEKIEASKRFGESRAQTMERLANPEPREKIDYERIAKIVREEMDRLRR